MDDGLTAQVALKMSPKLKKTLEVVAKEERRSLGSAMRILLGEALAARKRRGRR